MDGDVVTAHQPFFNNTWFHETLNVMPLTPAILAKHLSSELPSAWHGRLFVNWEPGTNRSHPTREYLKALWNFLGWHGEAAAAPFSQWPLIPLASGELTAVGGAFDRALLLPGDGGFPVANLGRIVTAMGMTVVAEDFRSVFQAEVVPPERLAGSILHHLNALNNVRPVRLEMLDEADCEALLDLFVEGHGADGYNPRQKDALKSLPIFEVYIHGAGAEDSLSDSELYDAPTSVFDDARSEGESAAPDAKARRFTSLNREETYYTFEESLFFQPGDERFLRRVAPDAFYRFLDVEVRVLHESGTQARGGAVCHMGTFVAHRAIDGSHLQHLSSDPHG